MPSIRIPTPLRAYAGGQNEVILAGQTAGEVIEQLVIQHPSLKPHLYNESAELRPYVNFFLDGNNLNDLQGLATPLKKDDRLLLIPSIAGGR